MIRRPTPLFGIGNGFGSGAGAGGFGGGAMLPMRTESSNNFTGNVSSNSSSPTSAPPIALAAAKQVIQQRLFSGGVPGGTIATPQRAVIWQPQTAYSTASIFQPLPTSSPFRQLQQQYQQKCQEAQQHQRFASSALFTPPPSPLYAPSHAHVHASSNSNNNTMPIINYNVSSRTRPFHNQAQDTLNTSALPAAMWLKCKSWQWLHSATRRPTAHLPTYLLACLPCPAVNQIRSVPVALPNRFLEAG